MLVVLSLAAAIGYGVSDFSGGIASRRVRPLTALLYGELAGIVPLLIAVPAFAGGLSLRVLVLGAAAGAAGLVGMGLMYRLMATEPLNVVAPVTGVLAAAMPLLFGVLGGEQPSPAAWAGIVVGLVAVALISQGTDGSDVSVQGRIRPVVVLLAVCSGAALGGYFVLIAHAGSGGVLPLIVARVTAVGVLVPLARRERDVGATRSSGGVARAALCAGAVDAVADLCFLLASRDGHLALAGMVSAFYPTITALLAVVLLRERTGWTSSAALGMSAVSLVLIAQ